MNFYLAARYSRRAELKTYAAELESMGHKVTARWLSGSHDGLVDSIEDVGVRGMWAMEDLTDIRAASRFALFTDEESKRGGCYVEFGYALRDGLSCVVIGPRTNVFTCIPWVTVYPTWEDFKASLETLGPEATA